MNREEYRALVRAIVGIPNDEIRLTDVELNFLINLARKYVVARLYDFCQERLYSYHTFTLTDAGDPEWEDLPSDYCHYLYVTVNDYHAVKVNYKDYPAVADNTYMDATATRPIFMIRGSEIGFEPSGSFNSFMAYIAYPTEFSDDTTDDTIPIEYQELVAYKSCEALQGRLELKANYGEIVDAKIDRILKKKMQDISEKQGDGR